MEGESQWHLNENVATQPVFLISGTEIQVELSRFGGFHAML